MKNKFIMLAASLLISLSSMAQSDQVKKLKKIYDKDVPNTKDIIEYKSNVAAAEPLMSGASESDKIYFEFYKAGVPLLEMKEAMTKPENASNPANAYRFLTPQNIAQLAEATNNLLAFEKRSGKQVYTKKIAEMIGFYKNTLVNYAVSLGDQKRFIDASSVLHSTYLLDKDPEKLYYAANYAINAKDYDLALEYYQQLKAMNFSGEKTIYKAVSKLTDKAEFFPDKAERDLALKITHMSPSEEREPSKRGEIYRNIALILIDKGREDEAMTAIVDARKSNPDDVSLIVAEAGLYAKSDEKAYERLINEALEKEPNNIDLLYNLGILSSTNKDYDSAEKYYSKVLEKDPNHANAQYNLAAAKLDRAQKVIDEMNKLGMTPAENKKYDTLKVQRDKILNEAIVILEKNIALDPTNNETKMVLVSVYNALEMTDKAKALKATIIED